MENKFILPKFDSKNPLTKTSLEEAMVHMNARACVLVVQPALEFVAYDIALHVNKYKKCKKCRKHKTCLTASLCKVAVEVTDEFSEENGGGDGLWKIITNKGEYWSSGEL